MGYNEYMNDCSNHGAEPPFDNHIDFLNRILKGRFPPFGTLIWDGETQQVSTAVHFELSQTESDETVRRRAYDFFAQLSPAEWLALEIEVAVRNRRPVRAILKPRGGVVKVGTGRLRRMIARMEACP